MSTELRPFGVRCNIRCHYCYQNPERDGSTNIPPYSLDAMKAGVEKVGGPFALFGGEPLLMPLVDLEDLLSWGHTRFGRSSIQTNGTLISEKHIQLFERYNVSVGVSIDGPGELNDLRWGGSISKTREATNRSMLAIASLCGAGVVPSLIVTLHRLNATEAQFPMMDEWFRSLFEMGVRSARLHVLEVDAVEVGRKYALEPKENVEAFLHFYKLQRDLPGLKFDVFEDIRRLLLGRDDRVSCVWRACDPLSTPAVQGIEGNGQRSNCGRVNKDGVGFVKADTIGYERYLGLFHMSDQDGGCEGCRFFVMCRGQCPGTALQGDWRLKSEHCSVWYSLFEYFEAALSAEGETPISIREDRVALEEALLREWIRGQNPTVARLLATSGAPRRDATEAS